MVDSLVECLHALCGLAWSTLLVLCTETSIVGHPVSCYAARPASVIVLSDVCTDACVSDRLIQC